MSNTPGETVAEVPDTLLLEERAEIALNALTRYLDESDGHRPFMTADLVADPPSMSHSSWDYGSSVGRLVSSIALAREMTGTDTDEIEELLRERLLALFDEDGLSYREESEHTEARANLHDQRSVLLGLVTWYLEERELAVKEAADDLCAALRRIAIKSGHPHLDTQDFWYFPAVEYTRDGWPSPDTVYLGMAIDPAHTSARMISPLVRYYEETGNEDALELARRFARHTVHYSGAFDDDGSFNDGVEFRTGHFHSRMVSVAAIARLARTTDDTEYLAWAKTVYDWALDQGTAFGWFPSAMREDYLRKHETCALTDMIEMGTLLARSGYPGYWETVERFVRNHLAATQLRDTSWIDDADSEVAVGERSRGAFPGWAAPNDFVCDVGDDPDIMTCCIASGTRGLFLSWSNVVTETRETVSVNVLLNRGTEFVDVHSYLPHEGRVELIANRDLPSLRVRIPSWVDPEAVTIDNWGFDPGWDGPFVRLEDVPDGTRLGVTFPVEERTTVERAAGEEYEVRWRGDDVIGISPVGKYCPLYVNRTVHEGAVPRRFFEFQRGPERIEW